METAQQVGGPIDVVNTPGDAVPAEDGVRGRRTEDRGQKAVRRTGGIEASNVRRPNGVYAVGGDVAGVEERSPGQYCSSHLSGRPSASVSDGSDPSDVSDTVMEST